MVEALHAAFAALCASVQGCRRCPAMDGRRRVLSEANGDPSARVLVIAEAPGRFGGDATGVPLVSDASGRRFTLFLAEAGIDRRSLFITNAVLCNPRDASGRNRTPSRSELANCRPWLAKQITLVDPPVIVTLGVAALQALGALEPHAYRLRQHAAQALPWAGRTVIPLYHPSPLARTSRTDAQQREDYLWLGRYLRENV